MSPSRRRRSPREKAFDHRVGPWAINVSEGVVTDGTRVHRLEPKPMDVLDYLARHAGRVVSRDELIAEVWRGAAITDGAVTRCVADIRRALAEDAAHPSYLWTIPKRGYQLLVPEEKAAVPRRWRPLVAASLLAVVFSALAFKIRQVEPVESQLVAVETFANLDATAESEQWGEGLSEDLLAALGQHRDLEVSLARSAGTVANLETSRDLQPTPDLQLSGGVRRDGDRTRVSCRLTSPSTGRVHCSGSCDLDASDRLSAQASAARGIALDVSRAASRFP